MYLRCRILCVFPPATDRGVPNDGRRKRKLYILRNLSFRLQCLPIINSKKWYVIIIKTKRREKLEYNASECVFFFLLFFTLFILFRSRDNAIAHVYNPQCTSFYCVYRKIDSLACIHAEVIDRGESTTASKKRTRISIETPKWLHSFVSARQFFLRQKTYRKGGQQWWTTRRKNNNNNCMYNVYVPIYE